MTYNHPIWDFIEDERLAAASSSFAKASLCVTSSNTISRRESAYIDSLAVFVNLTDPAVVDPAARLQAYANDVYNKVFSPYGPSDSNAGYVTVSLYTNNKGIMFC